MIWLVRAGFMVAIALLLMLAGLTYRPVPAAPAMLAAAAAAPTVAATSTDATPAPMTTPTPRPTATPQTIISRMARTTPTLPSQSAEASNAPPVVTISDAGFAPAELHVTVGASVRWQNIGPQSHDVSMLSRDRAVWGSGLLAPDAGTSRTFDAPGQYDYTCSLHTVMRGRIVVER
jgi:OOP family OmpA-OmpF porin